MNKRDAGIIVLTALACFGLFLTSELCLELFIHTPGVFCH